MSEQPDFFGTLFDEVSRFAEDVIEVAADFTSAGIGYDAKRAKVVAAFGDGDVGFAAVDVAGLDPFFGNEVLNVVAGAFLPLGHEDAFAFAYACEHFGEAEEIVGAKDHVDGFFAAEDGLAFLLGDTAADADDEVRICVFEFTEPTEEAVDFVLGIVADGAGVDDDERGVVRGFGEGIAVRFEHALHFKAVVLVHLATVGLNVCLARHVVNRP